MNKKNVDELFKERFRDFEEIPDEKVWSAIEVSLEKKKSQKIIPIWWKLGGVAAVLTVLFYVINPSENSISDTNEVEVSDIKNVDVLNQKNELNTIKDVVKKDPENSELVNQEINTNVQNNGEIKNNPSYGNPTTSVVNVAKNSRNKNKSENAKQQFSKSDSDNDAIASHEKATALKNISPIAKYAATADENGVAEVVENTSFKTDEAIVENRPRNENALGDVINTAINGGLKENSLVVVDSKVDESTVVVKEEQKKSIFEEIAKDEEVIAEKKNNRWSVGPSVAPVYFNGIGEGSPVHEAFVSNSKSGGVNLSYGVAVAYEVSKKLKIRSGVHKVDYGYTTNEIEFSSSFNGTSNLQITNINYTSNAKNIVIKSELSNDSKPQSFANDVSAKSPSLQGNLSQQFGYVEVPLELNYALIDKRFGINVIGGVSSLFLINNDVLLNSGDQTTEVGEANNINDVNFSTNFGFGLNYNFSSKLQFNVEPVFKYQLNTFSDTAGEFRPFSIGVYSGVSFKF
tara:strand:- start:34291 stop:35838 length:1548 start_codon:yes stop_codon:yes gene_type:complete